MSKVYSVPDDDVETVENALEAVNGDDELPDVSRTRGRPGAGEISTGRALAIIAEAFTGWSTETEVD